MTRICPCIKATHLRSRHIQPIGDGSLAQTGSAGTQLGLNSLGEKIVTGVRTDLHHSVTGQGGHLEEEGFLTPIVLFSREADE